MHKKADNNAHIPTPTYGAELEKPFSRTDGSPYAVGDVYFKKLKELKSARGEAVKEKHIGGRLAGVVTPRGEEALDNGFNNGESATGPVTEAEGGLECLSKMLNRGLNDVSTALALEDAGFLNMANHPLVTISDDFYAQTVAPKPVYRYLINGRGWRHQAGIDAKAQNSPSTGVPLEHAVRALNVVLGFGAAWIGLYANSPFEAGRPTGIKENRLAMWEQMFGGAFSEADRRLCRMPERPFENLRDYFYWMFGPGTSMYFVLGGGPSTDSESSPSAASEMKASDKLVVIDGKPALLEFLRKESWQGRVYGTDETVAVVPSMAHLELHQFTQFAGARVRYALNDAPFSVVEFLAAMHDHGHEVERLFKAHTKSVYIEGRDPGANFPDAELLEMPNGEAVARSVVISPSALQAGLIRNLGAAEALLGRYMWTDLRGLRDAAIRDGLQAEYKGIAVRDLARELVEVAVGGLVSSEQWMVRYPMQVLESGMNGADRALNQFEKEKGSDGERIRKVVVRRLARVLQSPRP